MSTYEDKKGSDDPSVAYNIEDDNSDTNSDMLSVALNTGDDERGQDNSDAEDEMHIFLDDVSSMANANKQVHLCMEGIMKAKILYSEKEKEAYEQLNGIRNELTQFKQEFEEPTGLSLEYIISVDKKTEKLTLYTSRILDILLPIMKCAEEANIAIDKERKKLLQIADSIHDSIIPCIRKYDKSIEKIKQDVIQKRKEEIRKVQDENWTKYQENIKNAESQIHEHYQTEIKKIIATNDELRNSLNEVNDRFAKEVEEKENENWEKYKEEIDKINQEVTQKFNTEIKKLGLENSSLRENLETVNTSVFPKLEKEYQAKVKDVKDKAKQDYKDKVLDLKNKYDSKVEDLQRENRKLTKNASKERPSFELQAYTSKIKKLEIENNMLNEKRRKAEERDEKRIQQMKQEIQRLKIQISELQKDNEMLNATVEEKMDENRRLDKELCDMIQDKERRTINETVETLQLTNDELRKEIIDKHILIDQAQKTLSRSKSLCDLGRHSKEEMEIRSNMIECMLRDADGQQQQISKDHAETLHECTGKSKSLQSLRQNIRKDFRFQKVEAGMFDSTQDLTEREMTAQNILDKIAKASKTTPTVQNNYNIITSNATFQKDCLVEAITATANSDRAITDS